ncbi:MAG: hypothetical protein ACLQHK_09715 [Gallionellaceae bacterium]
MIRFQQKPFSSFALATAVLLTACVATMQPTAVWMGSSYQSHPGKITVVGVARAAVNRRIFEEELVRN